jgi:hypothetical protein
MISWLEKLRKLFRRAVSDPAASQGQPRLLPAVEVLETREVPTVTYHGGALIRHVQVQDVFLGSEWLASSSLHRQAQRFVQVTRALVRSSFMDALTTSGYGVGPGSALRGKFAPVRLGHTLTDSQIQQIIQVEILHGVLAPPNPTRLYVIHVEPGVVVSNGDQNSVNDFSGYHGAFTGGNGQRRHEPIPYAVLPFLAGINGNIPGLTPFQSITATASHEIAEAVTDPGTVGTGWYDDRNNGEIADLTDALARLNGFVIQLFVDQQDQPVLPLGARPI